jgi:RNA polymerase sigma factor (sigma-70 family)
VPSRMPTTSTSMASTSWRLLQDAQRGDASALGRLVLRHLPRLRRWARGRLPRESRSHADTSDLLQDVLLRTLGRLDVFQPKGRRALGAYFRTAVRNHVADERRRAARWVMTEADESLRSHAPTPLQCVIDAETRRCYDDALARLGRRDHDLVVAHLELGYSHAQLGCMIGRTPHAARMALCRAMARLAEHMRG